MANKNKEVVYLISSANTGHFYTTMKSRKGVREKIEKKMYDPVVRKHVMYKEGKLKKRKS